LKDIRKYSNVKPAIWFVVDDPFGNKLGITDYSKQKTK
jgi:hypothetical protein